MRQAGRYMPQYRELRRRHTFLEICRNPELIVATTLLPIDLLDVDAAILFADILLLAEPMGFKLHFDDHQGPLLSPQLGSTRAVDAIPPSPDNIYEVFSGTAAAIRELKRILKIPLIGFAAAPFTLASYLIEGRTSRDLSVTKRWLIEDPESFHALLEKICSYTVEYLRLQAEAGAAALQLFDSWACQLSPSQFASVCVPYVEKLRNSLPDIPIIYFCRGTGCYIDELARMKVDVISADWSCDLAQLRGALPATMAIQGNLDPIWLYAKPHEAASIVRRLLDEVFPDPAYIFNLGHGIPPDVPLETVQAVVAAVKEYSR